MHKHLLILPLVLLLSVDRLLAESTMDKIMTVERKFEHNYPLGATELEFLKDSSYKIDYGSEGRYWKESGRWQIQGDRIELTPSSCEYEPDFEKGYKCSGSFGGGTCTLERNEKSLEFNLRLYCKSAKNANIGWGKNYLAFDVKSSKIPPGTELIYEGSAVVTVDRVPGVVSETLNLRSAPSERIDYVPSDFYDSPDFPKSAPKGTKFVILARTKEKMQVKSDSDYWYCIKIGALSNVWVFGKFITVSP